MLSAEQAKLLHGTEGDGCWQTTICYSRRSYARHRDRTNQTRSRKRQESEPHAQLVFEVLMVHRQAGGDIPVHAIGAEIWQGQAKVAIAAHPLCGDAAQSGAYLCGHAAARVGRAVRHQKVCQSDAAGPRVVCNPSLSIATVR